ncbi:GEMI6 protein, partial [Alaudala cheleensis]|nr:GEMI6 protein [Alaudala cheleensis]
LAQSPFLGSIVLATFPEKEKGSLSFIMGHAVQEVEVLQEGDSEVEQRLARIIMPEECPAYSSQELEEKKNALKAWLEANHIPVSEQGELGRTLSVAGVLSIEPPYGPEQCSSANEIILSRVQGLLQRFLQR